MASLDLGAEFRRGCPPSTQYVEERGLDRTGPVYGRYFQYGPDQVDVEIGIPLASIARRPRADRSGPARRRSARHRCPGGTAASVTHVGSYASLGKEYDRLHDWIHAQGREEGVAPWESYTDDMAHTADPSTLRTEVTWPLG